MGGQPASPAIRVARQDVRIPPLGLPGILQLPEPVRALVVFAHGSGSSRLSPRNTAVAGAINSRGMATLLFDLLTDEEEGNRANVFDIPLLAGRLTQAVQWVGQQPQLQKLPIGLFGASTGAAAALVAAAHLGERIGAVVSRGGRPDLAAPILGDVKSPTLLIVGGLDTQVIGMNRSAFSALPEPKAMQIVPNASHLFSEPGTMAAVIAHATRWFEIYLCADAGMSQA
ncbi:MAG: alpha/beta hydrolase [Pseudorhodoplanes sp.]|nr:MAG: alpha/beta hydrolase [Pseudorhodoplanes sp.]